MDNSHITQHPEQGAAIASCYKFRSDVEIKAALADLRDQLKKNCGHQLTHYGVLMAVEAIMWLTNQHEECCTCAGGRNCDVPPNKDGSPGCHNHVRQILKMCERVRLDDKLERIIRGGTCPDR
jgi:hypothetical protein